MGALNASSGEISPPEHVTPAHDLSAFDCGESGLNDWLRKRALSNEESGASRTYVVCSAGRVIGYYALASGAIALAAAPDRIRRNMPDPLPVIILGRLAVDLSWQGKTIGGSLLRDAILRVLQAAEIAGIRAILVHAISDGARRFYDRYGFIASPLDPLTLMLSITGARRVLASS
ncbi:MAG TPA: GNAT family N-acetyltransferase [Candidatus Acidoferrales bacterium]|nr:GNAT family N-acetyltransferase [Candidatus Acidoferrales bacterium]